MKLYCSCSLIIIYLGMWISLHLHFTFIFQLTSPDMGFGTHSSFTGTKTRHNPVIHPVQVFPLFELPIQ